MATATLYRSVYKPGASRLDPELRYLGEEVVFHGDLNEVVTMANALPSRDLAVAKIETEHGDFHSYDFDKLADGWQPADVDLAHGSLWVRLTKDLLLALHGDKLRYIRSTGLMDDHLEEYRAVVTRKIAAGEIVEDEGGKRVLLIHPADLGL